MTRLPSRASLRPSVICSSSLSQQIRHASLLKRPIRPYTFTQLVTLSDGSSYLTRTTSPQPVFKSTKDTRNHILWQPSILSLRNVEQDEAGRLKAFRDRFGRGWDLEGQDEDPDGPSEAAQEQEESLMDLIAGASNTGGGGPQSQGQAQVKTKTNAASVPKKK